MSRGESTSLRHRGAATRRRSPGPESKELGGSPPGSPACFGFCLQCGVTYESLRLSELAKLATLDREGRSSAMTVIASSLVRALRDPDLGSVPHDARKLLTFVDNRQDAALQAGHFNDFVQVVQLRAALYRAVERLATTESIPWTSVPSVTKALDLELA